MTSKGTRVSTKKETVTVFEVGPRDGLQNEANFIPTEQKVQLVEQLVQCGISEIEVTSFVSPKAIPQLKDNKQVFESINQKEGVNYYALIPNLTGLNQALAANVNHFAFFTAASNTFTQKNINCTIEDSLSRFKEIKDGLTSPHTKIRAYISCALGCPYEGNIAPEKVSILAKKLLDMGATEISLGDTIGVGTPKSTLRLLEAIDTFIPKEKVAMHFHNTYGQAIANIYASLEFGIRTFDSSIAGLGGCPYAIGASGNVATEDVVYLLHGQGFETHIDLKKLARIGNDISKKLAKSNQSHVGKALG